MVLGIERIYNKINSDIICLGDSEYSWLYIPTGATFNQVKDSLYKHDMICKKKVFERYIAMRQYDQYFKPGRYKVAEHMSLNELVSMLIRGLQTPVRVAFQHIRKPEELAEKISRQIEADSLSLVKALQQEKNIFTITIPNTYEMWWNSTATDFMTRMKSESGKFWEGKRTRLADSIGLTIPEVVTLASIVEKESAKIDEKQVIAGVYMNRLHRRWRLQADPTLIFAWNDFTITRVLNRHKEIDSPYNTYKFRGLPPGPICLPSISSIDAVLNYANHDYMYFCAKEDFSGYHVYAVSLQEHSHNARRYQKAFRKRNAN
ncbi:MAG: endolytic transglycosylase MltG [Bacteroidia bacterium]|nr:endolytic transglycosylase MltG [Bacteroidia bacterium]